MILKVNKLIFYLVYVYQNSVLVAISFIKLIYLQITPSDVTVVKIIEL